MCFTGTALLRGDEMGEKEKTRSATVFFLFANLKKEKAVFSESCLHILQLVTLRLGLVSLLFKK